AAEGEVLDPLRRPQCADLRARNPPHLFGVRAEERLVQPPAEARRHPLLERVRFRPPPTCRPQVRKGAPERLPEAEAPDDVLRRDRVREELAVVVDARESRPLDELGAENLLPQALDGLHLREEAVSAEIEPVAVELDRLRYAPHGSVGLEHRRGEPAPPEDI